MNRAGSTLAVLFAMSPPFGDPGSGCSCNWWHAEATKAPPSEYYGLDCVNVVTRYLCVADEPGVPTTPQRDAAVDRLALVCTQSWSTDLKKCVNRSSTRQELDGCWTDPDERARVARFANDNVR
jgi:hypothetical protein